MKSVLLSIALALFGASVHADDVQITTNPTSPIVFTSDFSYQDSNGNTVEVKGPWFMLQVNIANFGMDALTFLGLHVEVTGTDASGKVQTAISDFVPSQYNYTATGGLRCTYADFGQIAPGSTGQLGLTASSTGCGSGVLSFYVGSNPDLGTLGSIVYHVKVSPIGYYGTSGSPKSRFDGFVMIDTQ